MFVVKIDPERCKACGLCIEFCPRGCLGFSEQFNAQGYHPAEQKEPEKCTGCRQCVLMCPDVAIQIYRTVEAPEKAEVK